MVKVSIYVRWLTAWIVLALFCAVGCILALVNGLMGNIKRADRTFRTMSRLGAAVIGYSGEHSLSAECGARDNTGKKVIDWLLGAGHCEQERVIEGLDKLK